MKFKCTDICKAFVAGAVAGGILYLLLLYATLTISKAVYYTQGAAYGQINHSDIRYFKRYLTKLT